MSEDDELKILAEFKKWDNNINNGERNEISTAFSFSMYIQNNRKDIWQNIENTEYGDPYQKISVFISRYL